MKISKLFHWLYALVMLLPIFAIGVTCITHFFNKEVSGFTETAKINYKYESNEVNSRLDIKSNNIYTYQLEYENVGNTKLVGQILCLKFNTDDEHVQVYENTTPLPIWLYTEPNTNRMVWYFNVDDNNGTIRCDATKETYIVFVNFTNLFETYISYEEVSICNNENNIIDSVTTESESIDNSTDIFYYAVDKVTESPLFSWAYNSFLVAPFSYIVALFGMPTNHVVVELLSYWLAISIIWLVFDLVMYVPLLVHRWIDKGVLE